MVALVVATRDSSGMGIGARARLAAMGSCDAAAAPGPDCGLPEVVKPCAPAARGGVECLLRETQAPGGDIGDDAVGAVLEPHGGLDVAFVRTRHGVDLLRKTASPPAQRVDEVAAFAGEPRPLQGI